MKLGYAGISISHQDASMQIEALSNTGVDPKGIFTNELHGAEHWVQEVPCRIPSGASAGA